MMAAAYSCVWPSVAGGRVRGGCAGGGVWTLEVMRRRGLEVVRRRVWRCGGGVWRWCGGGSGGAAVLEMQRSSRSGGRVA
jgi:hypothetical protein